MPKQSMENVNLSEHVYYDETSPSCLRWARESYCGKFHNVKQINVGDVAGSLHSTGYYIVSIGGARFRAHRSIFKLHNKNINIDAMNIDHLDCDSTNNKISNLRVVTQTVNMHNTKLPNNNKTGFTGVYLTQKHPGKFYYVAEAKGINKEKLSKSFSIDKYGLLPAFSQACETREHFIESLNEQGAGYTPEHGLPRKIKESV